jgi:gamma-glutamyltranspeptidase/glutathione hydrolase
MLALGGKAVALGAAATRFSFGATVTSSTQSGAVVGDTIGAKVGEQILKDGGNAIDAAVASAFASGIASPSKCGVGGYGGHAMIALAGGKKVTSIDFNSIAPAAARPDMFPLDANGKVKGAVNITGWLAAGVPGTVAGLELALQRYGTRSLRDVLAPAIRLCEEGVHVVAVKGIDDASHNDPRPDLEQGHALPPEKKRNLALASLLKTLATRNSADSFYRGDIAAKIAAAFKRNGGLVTVDDLASYHARELEPLKVEWNGATMYTVPLPATGLLILEACAILKSLNWPKLTPPERLHAKLEALRIAWADRLANFGDPEQVKVPVEKLLSSPYAASSAQRIATALKARKPVPLTVDPSRAGGTTNISAVDRQGNMMAITLTHGGGYGARVSVEELGMVLGHGMSRFDPRPGLPNSPGPRKRPITNMAPTIVTRGGIPVFALGGAGGTRIPNALYEVLLNYVGLGASMETAMLSPRLDSNGTLNVGLEKKHPPEDAAFFQNLGYTTSQVTSAYVSAVSRDAASGELRGMSAGGA